jgi:thioredoxin reductase
MRISSCRSFSFDLVLGPRDRNHCHSASSFYLMIKPFTLFNGAGVPNLTPAISLPPGQKELFPSAPAAEFLPKDAHNILLEEHIHPRDYVNPDPTEEYDLVAIGAGVSGLISVIIGAWLGKKCALIERHGMGGDCLNTGCVPSKALIACARAAHSVKTLSTFGVHIPDGPVTVDFGYVMQRMREIRAKISHHDSVQRYSRDFCKHVFVGHAQFIGGHVIEVTGDDGGKRQLTFKKAMIATGASAAIPPVVGLREVPHLTNSNFFNMTELPPRLLVIGCGPIGLELSQSMCRLGAEVTCLEAGPRLLPREDPDASSVLRAQLEADGERHRLFLAPHVLVLRGFPIFCIYINLPLPGRIIGVWFMVLVRRRYIDEYHDSFRCSQWTRRIICGSVGVVHGHSRD